MCPSLRICGHLPAPIINGEEIAVENGRISDFQEQLTLTLTLDRVMLHTVMHHSSTSTYILNVIEIEETFCGRTDGRTDGRADGHLTHFIRSTRRSRPKNGRISKFEGLMTLTLTLDRVILHTFVHHSSTSTHMPNFTEIEKEFLWTDGRTDELCRRVDLKHK